MDGHSWYLVKRDHRRLRGAWKDEMRREQVRRRGQAKKAKINRMRGDMEERTRTRSCTRWMRRFDDDLDSGGEA